MAVRNLNNTLRDSLLTNESFVYAHLVKFEKPLSTEDGKSRRRAKDYVYLSDGSRDLVFDDGSVDTEGTSNGVQTYIANKVTQVGSVTETVEARASSMNIQMSMASLSTKLVDVPVDFTASTFTIDDDLVEKGFREGDIVKFTYTGGSSHGNSTVLARIESFTTANSVQNSRANCAVLRNSTDEVSAFATGTDEQYTIQVENPELQSIFEERENVSYARYINRDVSVYKVHINQETGAFIGEPFLLFKGIIASAKATEDVNNKSVISWTVTSHWGDFVQVSGRLTSDESHRALNSAGIPDKQSTIRPEYASDLGFTHSEQAVNLVAIYQAEETRVKVKYKKGFLGIGAKVKTKEYQVEVDREVDLRFNLDAKYLPVVYGVNKIDSIPVFVDTLANDPKKVYVAYALCEGQIGGLYDVYFDETSSICLDENDSDTRSAQTSENTIDVLCTGRMDRGDTLTGNNVGTGTYTTAYGNPYAFGGIGNESGWRRQNREAFYAEERIENLNSNFGTGTTANSAGITHERGTSFTTPIDTRLIFHSGKPDQKADALLIANSGNFKVQSDYFSSNASEYWGVNHKLLDTAYVVAEYTLSEGETTIPALDFVVRGRAIPSYNYDYSYEQHPDYTGSDAQFTAFDLGESVTLKKTSDDSTITTATIADMYTTTTLKGTSVKRIRFTANPSLGTTTDFYVESSGADRFHLQTYNNIDTNGTVQSTLQEEISSSVSTATVGGTGVDLDILATVDQSVLDAIQQAVFAFIGGSDLDVENLDFFNIESADGTTTIENVGATDANASDLETQFLTVLDGIHLDTGASSVDNTYVGRTIEFTRVAADNSVTTQVRTITSYTGSTRVATVNSPWDGGIVPTSGDTYVIYSGENGSNSDQRITTNPAMQVLDYLTSTRYGRGLDLESDIDLEAFKQAARACDTRSNVKVFSSTTLGQANIGSIYQYVSNGKVWFQGTSKVETNLSIGSEVGNRWASAVNFSGTEIEFEDVLGKLGTKWQDWKTFEVGELFWYEGSLYEKTGSAGTVSRASISGLTAITSITLTKVSGAGPDLTIDSTIATFDGNPLVKEFNNNSILSGYTLYDADDVKYWRYLGWEQPNQRWATRHQTNAVVNTNVPVFDNINNMLGQFNGILRYSNGKYGLAIKGASVPATSVTVGSETFEVETIEEADIVGSISVEDAGNKGTFNQVTVSIDDPQNRFEGRSITMFDSNYLKQDRKVPKKGNIKTPNITNYYNARLNAKQFLEDSRYSLKINFTMAPRGVLLLAGDLIRINYERFGWSNKLFRIQSLNFNTNCLVQVAAEEHNDSAYLIEQVAPQVIRPTEAPTAAPEAPAAPTALSASTSEKGGITLNWTNDSKFNAARYSIQIWRSNDNDRANATLIGTSKSDTYTDQITSIGKQTRYYWVRYAVLKPSQNSTTVADREVFSVYAPSGATAGEEGICDGSIDGITINLSNDNVTLPVVNGTPDFTGSGTVISAFIGTTQLSYDESSPYAEPSFRVSNVSTTGVTLDATPTTTATTYELDNITALPGDAGSATYTIVIRDSLGAEISFDRTQTFSKGSEGDRGPGRWNVPVTSLPTTSAEAETAWNDTWANRPGDPVLDDQAWFFTGTETNQTGQSVWLYASDSPVWVNQTELIDGDFLLNNSVNSSEIASNAVDSEIIAQNAVTSGGIAQNAVLTDAVATNAILTNALASNSVITNTLAANSVITNTLAANSVITSVLATNSVITNSIVANSVITDTIASNSVVANTIAANQITADLIAANSINVNELAANSITTRSLQADSITSDKISANQITSDLIAANAVTTEILAANSVTVNTIAANEITAIQIAANQITSDLIAANSITSDLIAANSINSNTIAAGSVSANSIQANSITASAIATCSITAEEIAANAIDVNELAANSITTRSLQADSVNANVLAANSVAAVNIQTNSINTQELAANSINANAIKSNSITSIAIASCSITAGEIAANAINVNELAANSITTRSLQADSVNIDVLAANSVNADKIRANSVGATEILSQSITTNELQADAVTADILDANSVTANAIAANQITANAIAANSITANALQANSITASEIKAGSIDTEELAAGAIEAGNIAAGAIETNALSANSINTIALQANSITAVKIAANAVGADEIAANSITANEIAAGTITANQIAVNAINADQLAANSITANEIQANTIDANLIRACAITAEKIASNSVTANSIAANQITADLIAANSVAADEIVANSINADLIAANQITADLIAANSINANAIAANSINANAIAANSITSDMVTANSVVATLIDAQSVTATDISVQELSSIAANIGAITAGTLQGGSIPDADASPSGLEQGAFLDLTQGKMVFGNNTKHILFDGTDLILSGVTIDANSIVDATSKMKVQNSGGSPTDVDDLNFGTNLDVTFATNTNTSVVIATIDGLSNAEVQALITEGTGVDVTSGVVSLDFSTLTDMSADIVGGTEFVLLNGTTESRKAANEIKLSAFDNDANFSATTGTVTSVAGTGTVNGITLSGSVTTSGNLSLGGSLSGVTFSQLDAGSIQTSAELSSPGFADNDTTLLTAAAIEDRILSKNYSTTLGTVTSVGGTGSVNGITLSGGVTSSGNLSLGGTLGNITVSQLAGAALQTSAESFGDNDTSLMTSAAINDRILAISSNNSGTVTSIGITEGDLISVSGSPVTTSGNITVGVDLSGLPDVTAALVNTDELILLDAGSQGRKALSEISLGLFDNSATSFASGTVTSVGITQGTAISVSGSPVTTSGSITVGLNLSGLSDSTAALVGTDELIVLDNSVQGRKAINEIGLQLFDNATTGFTDNTGTVTSIGGTGTVNGITLSGAVTGSGNLSLGGTLGNITFSQLDGGTVQTAVEGFTDVDNALMTAANINDLIESKNYTDNTGTVTSVGSGTGLSGGPITGSGSLSVDFAEVVRTSTDQTVNGNKTFGNNVIVSGNLTVSGSTTTINTQQLNVADNVITVNSDYSGSSPTEDGGIEVERGTLANKNLLWKESNVGEPGNLSAGWTFGSERVQAGTFFGNFVGDITGSPTDLTGLSTDNLSEGSTNLYFTNARAQAAITAGDGLAKSVGTLSVNTGDGLTTSSDNVIVDSTVLRTTGNQTIAGLKTFNDTLALNDTDSLSFESGKHWITYNDGQGNFNIRMSHYSNSSSLEECTEAGYIAHWEYGNSSGNWDFQVSDASMVVGGLIGTDANWRTQVRIGPSVVSLSHQGNTKLSTASTGISVTGNIAVTGTVDGVDIASLNSTVSGLSIPAIASDGSTPSLNTGITDAEIRALINVEPGVDVQAYNATLATVADSTYAGDDNINTVGTISTGTWNGSVIASAYLDADTAHLSGTQTFSGTKTFSQLVTISNASGLLLSGAGEGLELKNGGDRTSSATLGGHTPNDTRVINLRDANPATDGALLFTSDATTTGDAATEILYISPTLFEFKGNGVVVDTRSVSSGNGLTGGGDLSGNRTITLGTPSTLTGSSTNAVTASSHTHAITVNLGYTASTRILTSSAGTNVTLPEVVASGDSGLMTGGDKDKLDGIEANAEANVGTNITVTENATTVSIASSTGTSDTIAGATDALAGIVTNTTQQFGGVKTFNDYIRTPRIDGSVGQQLVLNAGESAGFATGQTGENVYVNAEAGLVVVSSPDNWDNANSGANGWANRQTALINGSSGQSTFPGAVTITGALSATTKSFLIEHPTKEGKMLRHGSLEGPENGVYVRGKLSIEETTIELPEYWTALVHEDTITVNLTTIGRGEAWVEKIEDNKVVVGKTTECFYMILAERKDVEKLIVEE